MNVTDAAMRVTDSHGHVFDAVLRIMDALVDFNRAPLRLLGLVVDLKSLPKSRTDRRKSVVTPPNRAMARLREGLMAPLYATAPPVSRCGGREVCDRHA